MNFQNAAFEAAFGRADQLPASSLPELVFSGRSNVGKSSLINKLVNRKALARVSAKPGKTATINFYRLQQCRLVDLPGYGYAKVSAEEKKRWASLVEGYFAQERKIACVVQIIDMRHPPTEDDLHMISFLAEEGFPFVIVATKSDKLNKTEYKNREEALKDFFITLENVPVLPFSAETGVGLENLQKILEDACLH